MNTCCKLRRQRISLWLGSLLLLGSGASAGSAAENQPVQPASVPSIASCADLRGVTIGRDRIGLPTKGAEVVSAAEVFVFSGAPTLYCRIVGAIKPIDASAPDILFDLALPKNWNGKALMFGGGGLDGYIPEVSGPFQPGGAGLTPLARGYAVFGSDGGHQPSLAKDIDGSFMANDEALANFGGDALKKTRDVAMALIQRRYGRGPSRTYFAGSSNGGREAFAAIQRWPQDFDGAIAAFPAFNFTANTLQIGNAGRLMAAPGGWISPEERGKLLERTIAACDALDGAQDGLISNIAACRVPLPADCRSAKPGEKTPCLAPAQLAWLSSYGSQAKLSYLGPDARYPGFPVDSGVLLTTYEFGAVAPSNEALLPIYAKFYADVVRYGIARDPNFDWRSFDPERPGKYAAQIAKLSRTIDAANPDLSAFQAKGGKLLVWHGLADQVVSHRSLEAYHGAAVRTMGRDKLHSFARFYMIPGLAHGFGLFIPSWDPLAVLERWVEDGAAPGTPVATDTSPAGNGRRRPLCEISTWPVYAGGDMQAAESFKCGTQPAR